VSGSWPEIDRRNPAIPDRRNILRGGRRSTDPQRPVSCVRCGSTDVRSLGLGSTGLWCECRRCRGVWKLDSSVWRRPSQ